VAPDVEEQESNGHILLPIDFHVLNMGTEPYAIIICPNLLAADNHEEPIDAMELNEGIKEIVVEDEADDDVTREDGSGYYTSPIINSQLSLERDSEANFSSGDAAFLEETPPTLRPLARTFLREVRKQFSGSLQRRQNNKFVETPDNWWTITPQPVAQSFRITIRARHWEIDGGPIEVKRDRNDSYSAFKFSNEKEIPHVMSILRQASQNRR
jgi:hypothetical protein